MSDQECLVPTANYPFKDTTFHFIRDLAPMIKKQSRMLEVPPVAVAGCIADEHNAILSRYDGWADWLQDTWVMTKLPNVVYDKSESYGSNSKWFNATRHDIGPANINIMTARQIYTQFAPLFPKKLQEWDDLVNFIVSDEGTVLIAALVIKKGMEDLKFYLRGRPLEIQEALLVTYFKQGPSFIRRYKEKVQRLAGQAGEIKPGEGCGVYHQRKKLLAALGG